MLHSRIAPEGQTRVWTAHGDPLIGVHLDAFDDHRDVARLGPFVRIATNDEHPDDALRPLEQPACIVRPTCDAKMIKRSRVAFAPNRSPFPDWYEASDNEDWKRRLTGKILDQARRA